jgi:hypothetical protein
MARTNPPIPTHPMLGKAKPNAAQIANTANIPATACIGSFSS